MQIINRKEISGDDESQLIEVKKKLYENTNFQANWNSDDRLTIRSINAQRAEETLLNFTKGESKIIRDFFTTSTLPF